MLVTTTKHIMRQGYSPPGLAGGQRQRRSGAIGALLIDSAPPRIERKITAPYLVKGWLSLCLAEDDRSVQRHGPH